MGTIDLSRRELLAGVTATPMFAARGMDAGPPPPEAPVAPLDLTGAKWIWLPGQRTLPCTFALFRYAFDLPYKRDIGLLWIAADSRYRLSVNGRRVQWGPAPCDARWLDVDPVDIVPYLQTGRNVIGVEVLYYGVGDGTWPAGKPGLLLQGDVEAADQRFRIATSEDWLVFLDRAHPPGQYKRWFLRALQEQFDARLHPYGWDTPEYQPDARWMRAAVLPCASNKPPASAAGPYSGDTIDRADSTKSFLRVREIPLVSETEEYASRLAESGRVRWVRDPEDWWQSRIPGTFSLERTPVAQPHGPKAWQLPDSSFATFEFPVQMVGFPKFTIEAPAGTVVELMPQESHDPVKTGWLDTHHYSWSRFICREGVNQFECFDYESLRWLQLSIRNSGGRPVVVRDIAIRRRQYPWPSQPDIHTSDAAVQRVFDAAINTVRNSVIETAVDGMGRERQQYSGDGGHQLHAVRYAFGDTKAPRRYLRTFSEGQMKDGYFADSWPAYDRLARVSQKQMDGAFWGPLLDHGVGFNFDCWNHYMETGDRDALREPYPRLKRFTLYLESLIRSDDLLPVDDLGIPTVWMDHIAFKRPRHRQCSFNLYTAAMLRSALDPIAELFKDYELQHRCRAMSDRILKAARNRFWSRERNLYIDNLPWLREEGDVRLSDRTLATAILFDQCVDSDETASIEALATKPPELGISYPCNAGWRYWALAKAGRVQPILDDLRQRWASMNSVIQNTTIQEDWTAPSDGTAQWSHCGVAPLYCAYMDLAGIRPTEPGFRRVRIRPQLGDLADLSLTAHTPLGPIEFRAAGKSVRVRLPDGCSGEFVAPAAAPQSFTGTREFSL